MAAAARVSCPITSPMTSTVRAARLHEGVVPVPADLCLLGGGEVAHGDLAVLGVGRVAEQAALQLRGELALPRVERDGLQRDPGPSSDLGRHREVLLGEGRGLRPPDQRHRPAPRPRGSGSGPRARCRSPSRSTSGAPPGRAPGSTSMSSVHLGQQQRTLRRGRSGGWAPPTPCGSQPLCPVDEHAAVRVAVVHRHVARVPPLVVQLQRHPVPEDRHHLVREPPQRLLAVEHAGERLRHPAQQADVRSQPVTPRSARWRSVTSCRRSSTAARPSSSSVGTALTSNAVSGAPSRTKVGVVAPSRPARASSKAASSGSGSTNSSATRSPAPGSARAGRPPTGSSRAAGPRRRRRAPRTGHGAATCPATGAAARSPRCSPWRRASPATSARWWRSVRAASDEPGDLTGRVRVLRAEDQQPGGHAGRVGQRPPHVGLRLRTGEHRDGGQRVHRVHLLHHRRPG